MGMRTVLARSATLAVAVVLAAVALTGCGNEGTILTSETDGDTTADGGTAGDGEFTPILLEQSREHVSLVDGGGGEVVTYSSPDEPDLLIAYFRDELGPGAEERTEGESTILVVREGDGEWESAEAVSIRPVAVSDVEVPADTRSVVERTSMSYPVVEPDDG
jgi:hypothetical protein